MRHYFLQKRSQICLTTRKVAKILYGIIFLKKSAKTSIIKVNGKFDLYQISYFVIEFRTKDRYKPVWEGLGTINFADGSVYQGQTKNGLFNGKGRMKHSNGDIY